MNKTDSGSNGKMEFVGKKLYVKYMVCLRCKIIVKSEIEKLGLNYKFTPHDAIEFDEEVPEGQYALLNKNLMKSGMVLLNQSESMLIDKIINTVIEVIHYTDSLPKLNFADLINKHAVAGDESILKIFSDVKGMSVLQFIVIQKIERTKELLLYEDMPLSEIAEILNYKNKHYLLAQFKKVTGLTPSYFKRLKKARMEIAEQRSNTVHLGTSAVESQPSS